SLASLEARIAAFDNQVTERQQEHLAHVSGLAERGDALSQRLAELSAEMDQLAAQGRQTQDGLAEGASALAASLAESRATIEENGNRIARLTHDSVRLLELIRASAEHSGTDLPAALGEAERRLAAFEQQATTLRELIADAEGKGATLAGHVDSAQASGSATLDQLMALENRLAELARSSDALAAHARSELGE